MPISQRYQNTTTLNRPPYGLIIVCRTNTDSTLTSVYDGTTLTDFVESLRQKFKVQRKTKGAQWVNHFVLESCGQEGNLIRNKDSVYDTGIGEQLVDTDSVHFNTESIFCTLLPFFFLHFFRQAIGNSYR